MTALIDLSKTDKAVGEVINLGSDNEISINDLAGKVKDAVNSKSDIQYIPYDEAYEEGFEDMMRRVPDLKKLHSITGYKPRYSLDDILRDTIEYYKGR